MSEIRGVVNPRNLDFEFAMADSTCNTQITPSTSKVHATQQTQLDMPMIEALSSSTNADQMMSDSRSAQVLSHTLGMPAVEAFSSPLSRDQAIPDPKLARGVPIQQPRLSGIPDPSGSNPPPSTQIGGSSGTSTVRSNPTQMSPANLVANTSTIPPSGVASSTPAPPVVESIAQPSPHPVQQPNASTTNATSQIPIPQTTPSTHTQAGQYPYNSWGYYPTNAWNPHMVQGSYNNPYQWTRENYNLHQQYQYYQHHPTSFQTHPYQYIAPHMYQEFPRYPPAPQPQPPPQTRDAPDPPVKLTPQQNTRENPPRGRPLSRKDRSNNEDSSPDSYNSQSPPPPGALAAHLYRGKRKIDMKDFPYLDKYPSNKAGDAHSFAYSFRETMALNGASERVMCLVFPTRLVGPAWDWYAQLPRGSIMDYNDLMRKFLKRFGGLRPPAVRCASLLTLKQEQFETSREFLARFSAEVNKVTTDFDEKLVLAAAMQGLRSGNLRYELVKKGCRTLEEFRECADQVIRAEEDAANMGRYQDQNSPRYVQQTRHRSYSPRRRRSPSPKNKKKNRQIKGPTYKLSSYKRTGEDYTPFYTNYHITNASREEMFFAIRDSKELEKPQPLKDDEQIDKSVFCHYHRSAGHHTRDCLKLKDEIERLIRQTHLLERYLEKNKEGESYTRKPYKPNNWKKNESRPNRAPIQTSRNNNPINSREEERDASPVIAYIAGGDASGGDTVKGRAYYANSKNTNTPSRYEVFHLHAAGSLVESQISFGPEDCVGVRYPHDDAIVLMLRIHGTRVKRILVDTGSSADVLYFDALKQLNLATFPLTPMHTPLVGFAGDRVVPLGTIELDVVFGESPRDVSTKIKFIVVNAPSAYNAILGRKSLNSIGAIASTKHLMIKFPTKGGVGISRGEQQLSRECYQVALGNHVAQIEKEAMIKRTKPPGSGGPVEEVEEVELGPGIVTKIGTTLNLEDRELVKTCLKRNADVFVEEGGKMPGIRRNVAEHRIKLFPNYKPVHQRKRKFGNDRKKIIEDEVKKLLEAGFIREVTCPEWLANPVVVPKPNNKWRMCIDFTDLNKACPKDPFPLPSIDAMVDSTAGFTHLSIVDANAGYHQIKMHPEDEEKTSFLTEKGLYCYQVMPFGLKNAGAEYQRMVNKLFKEELGDIMEAYIDDMVIKSCSGQTHVEHLDKVFAKMKAVGMRLNPKKSFFCLASGKFLGFIVSERGIEVHPSKCQAIMDMQPPNSIKAVQELTGRIAALGRFISKSAEICQPFFQTFKKNKKFQWSEECQQAFTKIKEYLATPPVISRPLKGETLYLYIAASDTAVSAALVREEKGVQKPVYFISRVLRDAETRYPPVEKAAFAVMIASRKLKPYFQAHPIKVLTELPLRRALGQLDVAGRLLKWAVELSEYDVTFIPRTAYKSQILADFVVECTARSSELSSEDEVWHVYVDGAASERGSGVGVEIIGPKGEKFHYAIHLTFNVSNNVAEYEALLAGLRLTEATGAKKVKVHTDSQLVVNQISGEYATTNEKLMLYLEKVKAIIATFEMASVEYVPRTQNETADALSKLAKESDLDRDKPIVMLEIPSPSIDVLELEIYMVEVRDEWYTLLWDFLNHNKLPEDEKVARKVKRWALEFTIMDGNLFKKGYGIPWLTCVGRTKADELMSEIHEGICGSHQGMKSLSNRIIRAGFYWPTLRRDVEEFIRRCEKCQFHSRIPRQPPHAMQSIASPWPFDVWGIDLLGPFPQGQGNVKFLVVAVEYFTKWIEAKPLATISSQKVVDFVRHQIVYRYGLPHTIISDNGTQFSGAPFQDFCKGLGIRSCTSSVCHPQSNGLAEVSNRTILEGLKKKIEGSKNTWPEYLDEILWAYRTTPRTATGRSPFAMVYGMEAVTPMEVVHPSLRTISYEWSSNGVKREQELTMIHELREEAKVKAEDYQRKMRKNFDKRVAPKHFQPGDWVLRKVEATGKPVGKLDPVWEGPFEVTKSIEGRAYHLQDMQGKKIPNAWNAAHLRKFYV
ncbi:hypothetical protein LUZ61_007734 [Rhynchospora tenuis]|uniref:Uncharacterized protein n=1 Tax=Rhynchospora tenuis TaxID=198213 RepID=A0AAD5ZU03_9POAL|nr:hypothetical protein LUZ61_007734 [Rhynchospora tenuis]